MASFTFWSIVIFLATIWQRLDRAPRYSRHFVVLLYGSRRIDANRDRDKKVIIGTCSSLLFALFAFIPKAMGEEEET